MEAQIQNQKGEAVGKVELPEALFGLKASGHFLHEAVTAFLGNQRRGTAHTKTRSEVSGGGRKPWKQKHTGRARHGSIRSPLWRKGGVVFGPRERSYRTDMPWRKTRLALAQALSVRFQDGALRVVDSFSLDGAKTRQVASMLKAIGAGRRPVLVTDQYDEKLVLAARNLPGVRVTLAAHLNAYEVLSCGSLVFSQAALEKLSPRYNG
jgi:large subunit ribosomal protein L4